MGMFGQRERSVSDRSCSTKPRRATCAVRAAEAAVLRHCSGRRWFGSVAKIIISSWAAGMPSRPIWTRERRFRRGRGTVRQDELGYDTGLLLAN